MKTLTLVGAAFAALLSGCATDPEIATLAMQRPPTLKVTCPVGGCDIEYRDPRDQGRMPTNGYDAAIAISGQITGLVGGAVVPAAMGAMAIHGFDALKGSGQVTTTTTTTTSTSRVDDHTSMVDDHTSTVDSHAVDSHAVTTTDNHAVDSHDVDDHSATAAPTVVQVPVPAAQ